MLCSTESNYYPLKAGLKVIVFDDDTRSHIAELSAPQSSHSPSFSLELKRNLEFIFTSPIRCSHNLSDHFITLTQETEKMKSAILFLYFFNHFSTVKRKHDDTLYSKLTFHKSFLQFCSDVTLQNMGLNTSSQKPTP